MYLIILEDSEIRRASTVTVGDLSACEDGLIDIIDLGSAMPKQYYNGEWNDISEIEGE